MNEHYEQSTGRFERNETTYYIILYFYSINTIQRRQSIHLSYIPHMSRLHTYYAVNTKNYFSESLRNIPSVKASSFKEWVSIMANSTWHVYGSIFVYLFICFVCQNVITQTESRPWYESLPAVAMDYKVHIDAGKEDCYYQYVQPGATFYVSFQVN